MPEPGHDEHEPEQLSGGDGPRLNWSAIAVVIVLVAGALVLARANHHHAHPAADGHQRSSQPLPVPSSVPRAHVGSVFLGHLSQCTRTDHRHRLSVAVGVTNLGGHSLQLVSAAGVSSDLVLVQPVGVRFGTRSCAGTAAAVPFRLSPGDDAVVTLTFRVGALCPRHALVSAQVAFDAGSAGVVHADSSQLADLDKLRFTQCA